MTTAPASPYKGLNAFDDSELDALFFFGREREREIVVANLIASRLTVLYGPSGVGKSSLLRAAVARSLRQLPEEPLVVVFSRWNEDPAAALAEAVAEAEGGVSNGSAVAALERAQSERDVYLILDQIEEYFLYHADDAGAGSFAEALPSLLSAPHRVNVLVALREDSLAKLDRFTGRIPGLFGNTLRLDRLDREAARAAIVRPVERFAELTGTEVSVEPGLVEQVLDDVGAGQIEPALGGLGAVEHGDGAARIEAPYLQLVMQRLWEEERAADSDALRVETLERLGGAQHIVEEHLEGAMEELSPDEKDLAARLFKHLVTPSGTKIAHEASDLADFGHVPVDALRPVLATLTDRRILRSLEEGGGVRYEIFHDVLAQPVLAWRARHRTERDLERRLSEAHRRRRRLQLLFALVLVALALMAAVTVFALGQRAEARAQANEAKAHELEALSAAATDPELGLLLAREAAALAPTETAEDALRRALLESRIRSIFPLGEPVYDAVVRRGQVVGATASGRVVAKDARTGRTLSTVETGTAPVHASFAEDATAFLTGRDGVVRVARPNGDVSAIPGVTGARSAEASPDGRRGLVIREEGVQLVDVETGDVQRTFPHPGALSAAISRAGRRVVTGGADDTVRLWSVGSGGLLRRLPNQNGDAVTVAYSPRGDFVASASTDGLGRVWRVSNGRLVSVLAGHGNYLTDIGFSTDGTQVVTASRDGTARAWRADTGAELLVLSGHTERVLSAAFLGGAGSGIVTASPDDTARLWDALVQPELKVLAEFSDPVAAVDFSAHGRRLDVVVGDVTHVVDSTTGEEERTEPVGPRSVRAAFGPNGATATIRGNTVVVRRDWRTTTLKGHRNRVTSASFSREGSLLVTASRDNDARIWNLATGNAIRVLQGHFGDVSDAEFSPDGKWVVTAGPRTAVLWDARNGVLVVYLRGHSGALTSATFDPSGQVIATGGIDGTVRTYRCEICGGLDGLLALAERRLAATGRELTSEERERYLG